MIYTVTLNPSLDYVMKLPEFQEGTVNRSVSEYITPGGKGINVSRTLNCLGLESVALGFCGGTVGSYIQRSLNVEGIKTDFTRLISESRINLKLEYDKETEVNASGPFIRREDIDELLNKLDRLVYGDFLVLSGSIGVGTSEDIYATIMEHVYLKKIKVVVDTTGIPFLHTLKYKPFLVKPNLPELKEITGLELNNIEEIIEAGKIILKMGAKNVLISLAQDGAVFINDEEIIRGYAPQGYVVNSVGSGDAMVAGFLLSVFRGESNQEALKSGLAAGSATAFSNNLLTLQEYNRLYKEIVIESIYK